MPLEVYGDSVCWSVSLSFFRIAPPGRRRSRWRRPDLFWTLFCGSRRAAALQADLMLISSQNGNTWASMKSFLLLIVGCKTAESYRSWPHSWQLHCRAAWQFTIDIVGATRDVRKALGKDDYCLSVFKDNAGVIEFNPDWSLVFINSRYLYKAEDVTQSSLLILAIVVTHLCVFMQKRCNLYFIWNVKWYL